VNSRKLARGTPAGICWWLPAIALWFAGAGFSHETGTSRFALAIGDQALETVFQFDVLTLLRIAPGLDRNRDGQVALEEVNTSAPFITAYLAERARLDIDGKEADDWGELGKIGWPHENGAPIVRSDYNRLLIQFPFRRKVRQRPKDVRATFDVFVEFGVNHRVLGEIDCGGDAARTTMVFTHLEPDYLFDVSYALKKRSED